MNGARNIKNFMAPPPGALGRGQISFNFNYKVNFKDFYSKLCVYSHKWKIQNISDRFFILLPGSCPRGGTWGYLGAKIKFRHAACSLCYLLLNHWIKFNQIWCVSYSHEWGAQYTHFFGPAPWGPGEGSKGQKLFNFNYKVNFKDFYSKLCVYSHKWKIKKTYQTGFSLYSLGNAPGVGLWGAGGAQVVKKSNF